MSRFLHAPDDAPLYRLPETLGGKVFPAYRVYANNDGIVVVVLDVDGELVPFKVTQVTAITRPEGLPDWAVAIILNAIVHEEVHGSAVSGGLCFCELLDAIPAEAREWLEAQR